MSRRVCRLLSRRGRLWLAGRTHFGYAVEHTHLSCKVCKVYGDKATSDDAIPLPSLGVKTGAAGFNGVGKLMSSKTTVGMEIALNGDVSSLLGHMAGTSE